jgi:uncharacterized protein YciI
MKSRVFAIVCGVFTNFGAYAQAPEYILVFLNKKAPSDQTPKEVVDKLMEGHMANIDRLAKEGKLVAAGPFEGGGGIFIFRSARTGEVKEWIQTDPAVKANRWDVEVLPYFPRQGSVCNAPEPYEMVTYTFIRYVPDITKFNIAYAPDSMRSHDLYLEKLAGTGHVVTEATFGPSDGGILVMRGDVGDSLTEEDPAVADGVLTAEVKKLWIARGAFCEK